MHFTRGCRRRPRCARARTRVLELARALERTRTRTRARVHARALTACTYNRRAPIIAQSANERQDRDNRRLPCLRDDLVSVTTFGEQREAMKVQLGINKILTSSIAKGRDERATRSTQAC